MTAAHRTLPFGTHLHVTNERNGKSCVVVVNDRGPFGPQSLVLDVSKAAAHKLGFPGGGKIPITCKVIDPKAGAIALKEIEADRLAIAEKIASSGQKKTVPNAAVKVEQSPVAKLETEKQQVAAKPQPKVEVAVKTATAVPAAHVSAPAKLEVASKPASKATKEVVAAAVTPSTSHVKPAAPEAPNHGTFLLVINDSLEAEPALKTAEYSTAKTHHNHSAYAPTVFMKVDESAAHKSADKNRTSTPAIADNKVLM